MKKTLLTGFAALFLATGAAHAANQLKAPEILGQWCASYDAGNGFVVHDVLSNLYVVPGKDELEKQVEECGDNIVWVKPNYSGGVELSCRYLSVQEWKDYNKAYDTKTGGAPTAKIISSCSHGQCTWHEHLLMYWSKGTLYIRSKSHDLRCK